MIAYTGWTGNRNIGDEALFLANKKLFEEYTFIEDMYIEQDKQNCKTTLLGGGTILPHAFRNSSGYSVTKREFNFGIGLGVRQERFDNRMREGFDLSYYVNKNNLGDLEDQLPNLAKYASTYLLNLIKKETRLDINTHYYFTASDYKSVRDFDFDLLSVRGPDSKKQLSKYDIKSEIVGDPALVLEPKEYDYTNKKRIGVCLRGRTTYSWSNNLSYLSHIIDFLNAKSDEYEIVFLPFEPQDTLCNYRTSQEISNATYKDYTTYVDVHEVINELNKCDLVIGEKLHANILSACCYTPFISIEYMPKHSDFVKSIDMESYNIRNDQLTKEHLFNKFNKAISESTVTKIQKEVDKRRVDIYTISQKMIDAMG